MKTGFINSRRSLSYAALSQYAKEMRLNPTEAERILWHVLANNRLGAKFRRQHIIGDVIADFACVSKGLVIEIDGEYHKTSEQQQYDIDRTQYLQERGFDVIRFTNDQVLNNLYSVISIISNRLASPFRGTEGALV